jgi:hypothetical protein
MSAAGWMGDRGVDGDPCSRPVRSAYHVFLRELVRASGALHAYGWRADTDEAHLHAVAGYNLPPGMQSIRVLPRTAPTVVSDCLRERKPVHADHATAERRYPVSAAFMQQLGARSLLALPVRGDRLHGVVSLGLAESAVDPHLLAFLAQRCDAWSGRPTPPRRKNASSRSRPGAPPAPPPPPSTPASSRSSPSWPTPPGSSPAKAPSSSTSAADPPSRCPHPATASSPTARPTSPARTRPAMVRGPAPPPSLHSMMDVPVLHGGVLLGNVQFARTAMHGCFTRRHLEWAQEFAKCVAVTLRAGSM